MYRYGMAGMGSYMLNLCEGLAEVAQPDEVAVFVQRRHRLAFERFSPRLQIRPVRGHGVIPRLFWQNLILPFQSLRYDALCCPATFAPVALTTPTVVVIHDLQYLVFPQYWSWPRLMYRRLLTRRTILSATRLVAISRFTAREIQQHFGRAATVISDPVMVQSSLPRDAPAGEPYFLVMGSLLPHKNIANLVAALEGWPVGEAMPRIVFIGPFATNDLRFVRAREHVLLRGFVSEEERDALLHGCVAVVVPSIYEGFGLPYAEAVLARKPVIAADIPAARELLGDSATFIPAPFDAAAIRATLRAAMKSGVPAVTDKLIADIRSRTDPVIVARSLLRLLREVGR